MSRPVLLRGAAAIGAHVDMTARAAQALHQQGKLPTFRIGGTPFATAAALDDWQRLRAEGAI